MPLSLFLYLYLYVYIHPPLFSPDRLDEFGLEKDFDLKNDDTFPGKLTVYLSFCPSIELASYLSILDPSIEQAIYLSLPLSGVSIFFPYKIFLCTYFCPFSTCIFLPMSIHHNVLLYFFFIHSHYLLISYGYISIM